MKKFNVSLAVISALSLYSCANAQSLSEALTNGKITGEFTTTYENRDFDKVESIYYQNTSYAVGSFALKYETGIWNNFSLTSKFRAYATLFEDDKTSNTYHGTGDASERFYEDGSNETVDIEELFLAYTPNSNISIKAGRQFISTDWMNKTHDALKVDAIFGNTSLEAIWSIRNGRVYARDYRPVSKFNGDKGAYKLALTHKFNDNITITAYDYIQADQFDILGSKAILKFADTSLRVHYAISNDDNDSANDSSLMDFMLSTSIAGFTPYIGFAKVDDDATFPGYSTAGEIIVPFEEGDYFYSKGAQTLYLGISKSFGNLSGTLLYGTSEYLDASNEKHDYDETTLWLGYSINKDLKANLGYTLVNETDIASHGDYNQINLTLAYTF